MLLILAGARKEGLKNLDVSLVKLTKDKSGEPDFRLNKRTCLLSSLSRLCRSWQLDGGLVVSFGRNLVVKFKSQASANELRNYI